MILLLAASQLIGPVAFEPPLVFAGERFSFTVAVPPGHLLETSDFSNVRVAPVRIASQISPLVRTAVVPSPRPSSFWLTLFESNGQAADATEVRVPVAIVPRWANWPSRSGLRNSVAFLVGNARSIALVPVEDNLGICILEGGVERRISRLLELDIAARVGPQRARPLTIDYMYSGLNHITILSRPSDLAAVAIFVTEEFVQVTLAAQFELLGRLRIAGVEEPLALRPGKPICVRINWSEL